MNRLFTLSFLLLAVSLASCQKFESPEISIITDKESGEPVSFGLTKLTHSLNEQNISYENVSSLESAKGKTIVVVGISTDDGLVSQILTKENRAVPENSEALTVFKTDWQNKDVWVIGGFDDTGLMYALLDVAEQIKWGKDPDHPLSEIQEVTEQPNVPERAVSLYTMNRAYWESRFYDEAYWERYLTMLAQNRFNAMVVIFGYENGGFLAPCYPYFFDTEAFPEIKLPEISDEEQKKNLDALNRLIDMAHQHGIKFKVGIWDHIYRGGVQAGGLTELQQVPTESLDWLASGVNASNLIEYTKTSLTKFIELAPGLDGIQFRMHNESGLKKEEQDNFWLDVFKMIKKTSPDMQFDLRAKELPESVIQSAIDVGINFRITTKYWMEQMGMPWHSTQTNPEKSHRRQSYGELLSYPSQYKMHWRLWNGGTSRVLLWGDPEYARRFAASTFIYPSEGFEVNEPLATKMEAQPHDMPPFDLLNPPYQYYDYEFERYWHFYQSFGRMGYNPEASPAIWQMEFENRFGKEAAPFIGAALHKASWVLPRIIASCYPYRGFPTTRGWAEKQRLGDLPDYAKNAGSDLRQFANFDEEAQHLLTGEDVAKTLPSTTSAWFQQTSSDIDSLIREAEKNIGSQENKEFISTMTDLKILSNLALYHSRRIPAAVSYNLFTRTNDVKALDEAIIHESNAIKAWQQLVEAVGDVYADNLMMGLCRADLCGHWKDELAALKKGLEALVQQRKTFEPEGAIAEAPKYQAKDRTSNAGYFKVTHQPVTQSTIGQPLVVRIKISAEAGIKWVRLLYRSVNQDLEYLTLPMTPAMEKDTYQAIVPANKIDPSYDLMYLVEMVDNKGRGFIYPDFNQEMPYAIVKLKR